MGKLTPELIAEARKADSANELIAIAKSNGIEMSVQAAEELIKKLNSSDGAISEDELEAVSGGGCGEEEGCGTLFDDGCPKYFLG